MLLIVYLDGPFNITSHLLWNIEYSLLLGLIDSNTFVWNWKYELLLGFIVENVDLGVFFRGGLFYGILSEVDQDLLDSIWVTDEIVGKDTTIIDVHFFYLSQQRMGSGWFILEKRLDLLFPNAYLRVHIKILFTIKVCEQPEPNGLDDCFKKNHVLDIF